MTTVTTPMAIITDEESQIDIGRDGAGDNCRGEYGGGGVSRVAVDVFPKVLGNEKADDASEVSSS